MTETPKWVDLFGIDPDYPDNKRIDVTAAHWVEELAVAWDRGVDATYLLMPSSAADVKQVNPYRPWTD